MNEKKIQTGLRIPKEQYDKLKAISEKTGMTINNIALHGIELWLMDYESRREYSRIQQGTV